MRSLKAIATITMSLALVGAVAVAEEATTTATREPAAATKTTKKAVKPTAKKATTKTSAVVKPAAKPVVAEPTVEVAAPVVVAPAAQTTTAPVAEVVPAAKPKRFSLLLDHTVEGGIASLSNRDSKDPALLAGYTVIRPAYKLTDNVSIALAGEFANNWAIQGDKTQGNAGFEVMDPYLMLAHSKLAEGGLGKLKGYVRAYAPLSQNSQRIEQIVFLRGGLTLSKDLGQGFTLSLDNQERFYGQKNLTAPQIKDGAPTGKDISNPLGQVRNWLSISKGIGALTIYQNAGIFNKWYNQDNSRPDLVINKAREDVFYAETGVGYDVTDNFSLTLAVYEDGNNTLKQTREFSLYRDDVASAYLEGTYIF